jgi:hypothetical protein
MKRPTGSTARTLAGLVETIFARALGAAAAEGGTDLAPAPDAATIAALVDAAFWASLRREEGRSPRISLALVAPDRPQQPLTFAHPLPLDPAALARLAPAVERPGIHLGVWRHDGELRVWGATRTLPDLCLVIEVVDPGLLVVKYRRPESFAKYGNVAVLRGNEIQLVDERSASLPDCPSLISTLVGVAARRTWAESGNVLVQLATSMRGHGRGGSLLIVPRGNEAWRESIVQPVLYAIAPAFAALAQLVRQSAHAGELDGRDAHARRLVESVAGVTAVDGAAVMTDDFELLAFGAKIGRRDGSAPVERVILTAPVVGDEATVVSPLQIGGTRHLSAAQFVHDQPGALALVASQDGHFTAFAWSPCENMVHAHRLDVLLL